MSTIAQNDFREDLVSALDDLENETQFANGEGIYLHIKPVVFMEVGVYIFVGIHNNGLTDEMILDTAKHDEEERINKISEFLVKNGIEDTSEFFFNDVI